MLARSTIVGGPASPEIGTSLSKILKLPLVSVNYKQFPDTELKITMNERVDGLTAILVQSTYPPVDKHIMELLFLAHHLRPEGAKVHAVIPYLAYARQEGNPARRGCQPGRALAPIAVGGCLEGHHGRHSLCGGALTILCPDLQRVRDSESRTVREEEPGINSPIVISPDFGASKRTEAFAALYGAKFLQLSKQRDRTSGAVTMEAKDLVEVKGNDVLIVDDIISTGRI